MKVKELIAGQHVVTARLDQPLEDVANLMAEHRITGVPIVDEWGVLAGLVTASRVMELARHGVGPGKDLPLEPEWSPAQRTALHDMDWRHLPAREAMVTDLLTVDQEADVKEAARALVNREVHRAVVLGQDRNVTGIVSSMDFTLLVAES